MKPCSSVADASADSDVKETQVRVYDQPYVTLRMVSAPSHLDAMSHDVLDASLDLLSHVHRVKPTSEASTSPAHTHAIEDKVTIN